MTMQDMVLSHDGSDGNDGETALVPPNRLAGLLGQHRREHGLEIADLARRSDGRFSAADLASIELGRAPLGADTFERIVELYQIDAGPVVPGRSELVLDLVDYQLRVEDWQVDFESPTVTDVLERYVALLQVMREAPAKPDMALREDDLSVLAFGLHRPVDTIREQLRSLVATPQVGRRAARLRRLSAITGTGVLVAATAVGALVLVRAERPGTAGTTSSAVATEPLRVEASLAGVAGVASGAGVVTPERIVVTPSADADGGSSSASPAASRAIPELTPRAAAIEASIPWDFRSALPDWTIDYAGPHPEWRGVANSIERRITLYDRAEAPIAEAAEVLVHELGHAVDLVVLSDVDRFAWREMRGIDGPWWAEDGRSDFSVGAGDFAEAVAALVVGSTSRSDFGPFDEAQLAFVAERLPGFEAG